MVDLFLGLFLEGVSGAVGPPLELVGLVVDFDNFDADDASDWDAELHIAVGLLLSSHHTYMVFGVDVVSKIKTAHLQVLLDGDLIEIDLQEHLHRRQGMSCNFIVHVRRHET